MDVNKYRTANFHNLELLKKVQVDEEGFPIVGRSEVVPDEFVDFSGATSTKKELKSRAACHFYLDDYRFERIWTYPEKYFELLKSFKCVIQADFSLYLDMPRAIQMWNKYRSNLLAAWWQAEGIEVVPSLVWSDRESFDFAFKGLPRGGVYATTAVGCHSGEAKKFWEAGMAYALEELKPETLLFFGKVPVYDFGDTWVISYKNTRLERVRNGRKRNGEYEYS